MAARRAGSCALRWLPPSVLLLLTVLFSASPPARALRFDLESDHTKCISDEIKVGSMAVGKYHVADPNPNSPDSHRISLRVSQVDMYQQCMVQSVCSRMECYLQKWSLAGATGSKMWTEEHYMKE